MKEMEREKKQEETIRKERRREDGEKENSGQENKKGKGERIKMVGRGMSGGEENRE